MESAQGRRFYIITAPRTASHLFCKVVGLDQFNLTTQILGGGYYFLMSNFLYNKLDISSKSIDTWTQEQKDQVKESFQGSFDVLQQACEQSDAENKPIFIHEHSTFLMHPAAKSSFLFGEKGGQDDFWTVQIPKTYGTGATRTAPNETVLPDEFLRTLLPTFLIRHPALSFPSFCRKYRETIRADLALDEDGWIKATCTFLASRQMYDWYVQQLSQSRANGDGDSPWPIVLDADDVMTSPEVLYHFCDLVGLDRSQVRFEWNPLTEEELKKFPSDDLRSMLSTLNSSSGIMRQMTSANIDLNHQADLWRKEFGDRDGEELERWVRAAMPDYEYLRARRLKAKPTAQA